MGVDFPDGHKPASVACKNILERGGCSVYANRPDGCRVFKCVWLTLEIMPNSTRPDLLGVMFHYDVDEKSWNSFAKVCIIASPVKDVKALHSPTALACYQMAWKAGLPLWFDLPNKPRFLVDERGTEILPNRLMEYEAKVR